MVSIDRLPDGILLETFHFYVYDGYLEEGRERAWQSLVHVCRRWRSIVFGSPRYLDLQLVCTPRTPARDMLDVWPALPLVVQCGELSKGSADNIIAPLERSDRVCQVRLSNVRISKLETFLAVMQKPFPELTHLELWSDDRPRPLVPESFLDGSAPRLEYLYLAGVQFPRLPKLLSSTTHLNSLKLNIPHSEYISPDAMGSALSSLTSLKSFLLEFPSSHSRPDQESRGPPPSTRSALPVLREFEFKGASEYLDDLVAHIDTPQLDKLEISFFENIVFNAPQLIQFISRSPIPSVLEIANIVLFETTIHLKFSSRTSGHGECKIIDLHISCGGMDQLASSMEQIFSSCLPPLSMLEDLYVDVFSDLHPNQTENNRLWLEVLRLFTTVKNLYLPFELSYYVSYALQDLVVKGRTTEVLPALQHIFWGPMLLGTDPKLPGRIRGKIGQFIAARQVAGHSIVLSRWDLPLCE